MDKILILSLILLQFTLGFGQSNGVSSRQLSQQEVDSIFNDNLKKELQIEYSIYRAYQYNDIAGKHFIVMTENLIECEKGKKCSDVIKAYCFENKDDIYKLKWTLNDFILPNGNEVSEEYSISFWTKYFRIDDYDGDGIVDLIMIYGTYGNNGPFDGRVKILIYHNDEKIAIRHQNSTLDPERNTQVDAQFYQLPTRIQDRVKSIMEDMLENEHGVFPYKWREAMANKELKFDEN